MVYDEYGNIIGDFIINEQKYFKELSNKLNPNHKQKAEKSLSDFDMEPLTKDLIIKFKGQGKLIHNFRDQNPKYPEDTCIVWIDGDKYVGALTYDTNPDKNGYTWISGLDVAYKYRGCGLGRQIVEYAISQGVNALSVQYDNEVALKLYKKLGFRISKSSEKSVKIGKTASYDMYLNPPD